MNEKPPFTDSCKYIPAYSGYCNAPCIGQYCEKHDGLKCCVCGSQATNECNHTGQFVCGARLCDTCEGYVDESKPSGAWGFMNHRHRLKVKHAPPPENKLIADET